ncbi:hypothetical protein NP493_21g08002 [Ridgeia piscesae]|uniref:Uncharacterized protein n=1 Tax=Ridgeia piscesae TaxID=27915 RepID=A0AAD9PE53_RIDPI|nr:hypothetical protein NP493_5235g00004 [Ridgeia piscesae]KAK2192883.1 hypothetical protein NP493_21g08002 [Ridgeia piscesae]
MLLESHAAVNHINMLYIYTLSIHSLHRQMAYRQYITPEIISTPSNTCRHTRPREMHENSKIKHAFGSTEIRNLTDEKHLLNVNKLEMNYFVCTQTQQRTNTRKPSASYSIYVYVF